MKLSNIEYKEGEISKALITLKLATKFADIQDTLRTQYYINRYKSEYFSGLKKFDSAYKSLLIASDAEYQMEFRKKYY